MAHTVQEKHKNIQKFLKKLDKTKPDHGNLNNLRTRVNDEDPTVKTEFNMENIDGYAMFWNDFYTIGLHAGTEIEDDGGELQTSHAYLCCCC